MLKKLFFLLLLVASSSLLAQEVILSDEFDDGDGQWNTGWIDPGTTTVTTSIDTTGKLSGANSYKIAVTTGGVEMWRIQRVAALPLKAGYQYTLSFMAVADQDDAGINVLFEIGGDPYTKRLDDTATVTTTPQTFTYVVNASENVADNFVKLMFGSTRNDGTTIWIDAVTVTEAEDPTLISLWGLSGEYNSLWPILNDSTTARGSASMGGEVMGGWRALQGGFGEDMMITTETALVLTGKLEYVGGAPEENAYTPIRYALTYQDSNSTLVNALTDSATWSHTGNHFGYGFHPRTGTGTMSNGNGGVGTVWTINNGNWASTWSNNGLPIAAVNQAPRNAHMVEGVYDFAISVHAIDDTSNEIRWYMIEENNGYWFGGTVVDTATTKMFNSILIGVDGYEGTAVSVANMRVELGDPISVPEAPWEDYYIDQWGLSGEYNSMWPILNDSTTLVGDASMSGDIMGGWRALQGGFGQDVSITTETALIIEGQLEFAGGAPEENAYTPIRYALTYQDSNTTLVNALTDSATWSHTGNHFGYGFHPRTGTGTMSNGNGGVGTVWTINNGNWASTWSNNGGPIAAVNQAPRNAHMVEGVYDFAISVHAIDDTSNEIRWYMIEENNGYWFGGTVVDTATTTKFNSILIGVDGFGGTAVNAIAMQVKKGAPIDVPEAPWEAYYVDQWGATNYNYWPVLNDTTTLVGDATIGDATTPINGDGWASILGGFGQDLKLKTDKSLIVTGEIEFVGTEGGGNSYTPLRYAITYMDSAVLNNPLTDSAEWAAGSGAHSGYGFHPRTGAGTMSNGNGGSGTVWTVNKGNWVSTWSNNGLPIAAVNQAPRNANMVPGTYKFAFSVKMIDEITNEIKWYLVEENNAYWFGGTVVDTATTDMFNSIVFGVNTGDWTQVNVIAAQVDYGEIEVPKAPWEDFYVDTWGIYGGNSGGWALKPGEFTGNTDFVGTAAPTGMAVVRGELGLITPEPDVDIFVLEGSIVLEGGGFEGSASLLLGLFNGDAGGTAIDSVLDSSYVWTGTDDNNSGYLILAQEGSNNTEAWSDGSGNWGRITNDVWSNYAGGNALGDVAPLQTAGGAGTYDFQINVVPKGDGTSLIQWILQKEDGTYYMEGGAIDNTPVLSFNSFVVGIGEGASATTMLLRDVQATMVDKALDLVEVKDLGSAIPTEFALNQNYPNPFNPTTTIEFAIPKNSEVKIAVYDVLGRMVTELANGDFNAGYYKVNFNASSLASGVYYYRIKAGDFVSVKKLVLLK